MTTKQVINYTPKEAYQRQLDGVALLIDVRSQAEYHFVGHPTRALHISWEDAPTWKPNPCQFVEKIKQILTNPTIPNDIELITICRSGVRSLSAGRALLEGGLSKVGHVPEGFEGKLDANKQRGNINGWRFYALPWQQS